MADEEKNDDLEQQDSLELETDAAPTETKQPEIKVSLGDRVRARVSSINIYMLIFLLVLLFSVILIVVLWRSSASEEQAANTVELDTLSQEALDDLRNKDASIGDAKQTLTIASDSIFNGRVLVRDSLDVAGTINVGGALSLPGITVSGTSSFDEVQVASNLTIGGDTGIQGNLSVQQSLSVSGSASFGGAISAPLLNIETLALSNDLELNRHIDAGGGIPVASSGSAIGSGGTANSNGSDTAGTVTINTGSGASAGTLANVTFANNFNQTPHVVISPVGSAASGIDYYVTRTTSGFTIATSSVPPSNATLVFDFVAID